MSSPPLSHEGGVGWTAVFASAYQRAEVGLLDELRRHTGRRPLLGTCRSPRAPRRRARRSSPGRNVRRWAPAALCCSTPSRSSRPPSSTIRSLPGSAPTPTRSVSAVSRSDSSSRPSTRPRRAAQSMSPAAHVGRGQRLRRRGRTTPTMTRPGSDASRPGHDPSVHRQRTNRSVCTVTGSDRSPPGGDTAPIDGDRAGLAAQRVDEARPFVERGQLRGQVRRVALLGGQIAHA